MDRFKFRGKRTDNGELVYGSLLRDESGWHIATFEDVCVDSECNSWELKLVLVGIVDGSQQQCTGLKDKDGDLIFEGDDVELYNIVGHQATAGPYLVRWNDGGFEIINEFEQDYLTPLCKIIANIHKNPEVAT